jgi:hypothetical protein
MFAGKTMTGQHTVSTKERRTTMSTTEVTEKKEVKTAASFKSGEGGIRQGGRRKPKPYRLL